MNVSVSHGIILPKIFCYQELPSLNLFVKFPKILKPKKILKSFNIFYSVCSRYEIFCKNRFLRSLKIWHDATNSLQVRILILTREVGYLLFRVGMSSVRSCKQQLILVVL